MIVEPSQSPERKAFYPTEENLGRNCLFWDYAISFQCQFPKAELEQRTSCEGIVDDVCLFLKIGRPALSLTEEQMREIKTRAPGLENKWYLPPGDIT